MGVGGYNTMTHTTKHTPGPWYPHLAKADHCLSSSVWGAEPGNQVAVIGGKSLETMNANAHLIAAAPAMYEALETVPLPKHNEAIGEFYTRFYTWYEGQVKQVLAQAEGR